MPAKTGVIEVEFAAGEDPLFGPCGARQRVAVIHWQSVLRLPAGAQVLGSGVREPFHAVRFLPWVWGVQFHPEFSPEVLTDLVGEHPGALRELGRDPAQVAVETSRWREQTGLISRFARLAGVQR
jgi:GMP synthase (glutamine-hydrolysing)